MIDVHHCGKVDCSIGLAGNFSRFFHSLSTAAFAFGIYIAWSIGTHLYATLQWLTEVNPFSAMWSSWFLGSVDSKRLLVDSWASTMHARFCLLDVVGFFGFVCGFPRLVRTLLRSHFTKHRRLHRYLQLFLAFFFLNGIIVLSILRIDEVNVSQLSSIIKLWFF